MMLPGSPIPGQTPLDDLSGLRNREIATIGELNSAEAESIRKATVKYLAAVPTRRMAPFDGAWLLALHEEMFGSVWTWAGTLRKRETNIGSLPHMIESDLHNLLEDLKVWRESMSILEQSARLHHVAVKVHPFPNGNGRWARMLGNIWLKVNDAELVQWPEATIGTASIIRDEYLQAVRRADRGDYASLLELHEKYWIKT